MCRDAIEASQPSSKQICFVQPAIEGAPDAFAACHTFLHYVLQDTAALARGRQTLGVQSGDAVVAKGVDKEAVLSLLKPYLSDEACKAKAFALEHR